jgi:hypothetical protein
MPYSSGGKVPPKCAASAEVRTLAGEGVYIYTIHSGGKVPPKCNAVYIIKYKEDILDDLDCVTLRKAKNQSMEKCNTR